MKVLRGCARTLETTISAVIREANRRVIMADFPWMTDSHRAERSKGNESEHG
jgi:hypothetical protein